MKKVTTKFLKSHDACNSGMEWVTENKLIGLPSNDFLNKLIENNKLDWANWLIVRLMNKKQKVQYAIFAAEQVIHIYEKKYPNDDRPRKAIEAAKNYLNNPSKKTKAAAAAAYAAAYAAAAYAAAAYAAAAAAYAADAAASAADAAASAAAYAADADAAYAAADAAAAAAYAADADAAASAAYAAAYAAYAADAYAAAAAADAVAADAYAAARKELKLKILDYVKSLLFKPPKIEPNPMNRVSDEELKSE